MRSEDFDKPLDKWIDETVNVRTLVPVMDEKNKRVKLEYQDVPTKQRTMYVNPPSRKVMCAAGEHEFYCADKHKYIFACNRCSFKRQVFPTTYEFKDGNLIHKITGRIL